jgi:hypothetical protein
MGDLPGCSESVHQAGEGLAGLGLGGGGEVCRERCRGRGVMPSIVLEKAQTAPGFEERGGSALAQGRPGRMLGDATGLQGSPQGVRDTMAGHRDSGCRHPEAAPPWRGKEPQTGGRGVAQEWRSNRRVRWGRGTERALAPLPARIWTSIRALAMAGIWRGVPFCSRKPQEEMVGRQTR